MAFRSSNVSSDRAPPRGPFAPERMRRRSRPRDHGRPAIRSESPRYRVLRGRNRRPMHAPRRFECRNSVSATSGGNITPSREAAAAATARVGPWTTPLAIIRPTDREASGPPMAARASNAAACSGTLQSTPKPTKRLQRVDKRGHGAIQPPPPGFGRKRTGVTEHRVRGELRSTPRPTGFVGQGAAPAAHSMTLGSAHGQQTGRVDRASSYSQVCPGRGRDSTPPSSRGAIGASQTPVYRGAMATKRSKGHRTLDVQMDCFASLAMTAPVRRRPSKTLTPSAACSP